MNADVEEYNRLGLDADSQCQVESGHTDASFFVVECENGRGRLCGAAAVRHHEGPLLVARLARGTIWTGKVLLHFVNNDELSATFKT